MVGGVGSLGAELSQAVVGGFGSHDPEPGAKISKECGAVLGLGNTAASESWMSRDSGWRVGGKMRACGGGAEERCPTCSTRGAAPCRPGGNARVGQGPQNFAALALSSKSDE